MEVKTNNPLSIYVKFELRSAFCEKINQTPNCKVVNVIEMIRGKLLEYQVECPEEKHDLIIDFGYMTWISNPLFQRYYGQHPEFLMISQEIHIPALRRPVNPTPNL